VDTSKISFGETVAAASAGLLFVFMFIPWFGASAEVAGGKIQGGNANAWQAFSIIDILLFLVIAVTIGLVVARAAGKLPAELPAPPGVIILGAGVLAALLIIFRLINTPGEDVVGFGVQVDVGRKIGIFLGLIAAAGIAFGGKTAMDERTNGSFRSSGDDQSAGASSQ
jgi:hypothetical protein